MAGATVILETLVVRLTADTNAYTSAMRQAEGIITDSSRRLDVLGRQLSAVLANVINTIIGTVAVKAFAEFDDVLTRIMARTRRFVGDIKTNLGDALLTFSASGKGLSGPVDLATAYGELARNGFAAKTAMDAVAVAENFATANNVQLGRAVVDLVGAQKTLGLVSINQVQNLKNLSQLSDVLTRASIVSGHSVDEFSQALSGRAGRALKDLRVPMEQGVAVLGAFMKAGMSGADAGSNLALILKEIQRAAVEHNDAWRAMGITAYDASGKFLSVGTILAQIEIRTKGLSDKQRQAAFELLGFSSRSIQALQSTRNLAEGIMEMGVAVRRGSGSAEIAKEIMGDFRSQMIVLKNTITALSIEMGSYLAPYVAKLNFAIREGINWWAHLHPEVSRTVLTFAAFVLLMGPAVFSLTKLSFLLSGMTFPLRVLVGLITPLNAVLVLLGVMAVSLLGPEGLAAAWTAATSAMANFISKSVGFLTNFSQNMSILFRWLSANWKDVLAQITEITGTVIVNMVKNIGIGLRMVAQMLKFIIIDWLPDNWRVVLQIMVAYVKEFWNNTTMEFKIGLVVILALLEPFVLAMATLLIWPITAFVGAVAKGFIFVWPVIAAFFTNFMGLLRVVITWVLFTMFPGLITGFAAVGAAGVACWAACTLGLSLLVVGIIAMMDKLGNVKDLFDDINRRFAKFIGADPGDKVFQGNINDLAAKGGGGLMGLGRGGIPKRPEDQIMDDMKKQMPDVDKLKQGLDDILKKNQFINPLEGLQNKIKELPDFNLNIPEMKGVGDELKDMKVDGGLQGLLLPSLPVNPEALRKHPLSKEDKESEKHQNEGPGDTFKEFSLRRFILDGPGSLSRPDNKNRMQVNAPAVESKMDKMIDIMENKEAKGPQIREPVLDY